MEDRRTDQSGASKPDTTPTSKAASQQAFAACRAVLESEVPPSPAEQAEHRRRLEPPRRPPAPSLAPTQRWDRAPQAEATHPYLKAKCSRPHGTRREGEHLLIPVRRGTELVGLQAIAPDGTQRFLDGGEVAGGYCAIGKPKGVLCIAISFAAATAGSRDESVRGDLLVPRVKAGSLCDCRGRTRASATAELALDNRVLP